MEILRGLLNYVYLSATAAETRDLSLEKKL